MKTLTLTYALPEDADAVLGFLSEQGLLPEQLANKTPEKRLEKMPSGKWAFVELATNPAGLENAFGTWKDYPYSAEELRAMSDRGFRAE
jgi:hypothetical protein